MTVCQSDSKTCCAWIADGAEIDTKGRGRWPTVIVNLEGSVRSRGTTVDMALNATSLKPD